MCQAMFFRSVHNCLCHRMREVFFHAGSQSQKIFFGVAVERYYIYNCRLRFCQRTRLIKDDCISLSHCFHELAAFYCDMMRICLANCCKYRNRHGQFQCTGEVNHQNRQCLRHISGNCIGKCSSGKCIRNKSVCKMLCLTFYRRFQFLCFFDHCHDLFELGRSGCFFYTDGKFALFENSSCINIAFCMFGNRHGFTCQGSFIDRCLSIRDNTVKRDHSSHMYTYPITRFDRICADLNFCVIRNQPYFTYIQGHASCKIIYRFLMRPVFQYLTKSKQEHD